MKASLSPARRGSRGRQGASTIELALLLPLLVMMSFGCLQGGVVIERYMSVLQLVRTAGMMSARGVDLSKTTNQQVLLLAANGLHMTSSGGSGVVYVSTVTMAPSGTVNAGKLVISERYAVGNTALGSSRLGTPIGWPDTSKPLPNGYVANYTSDPTAVAANMPASFNSLGTNETVIVAEVYHQPSDLSGANSFFGFGAKLMYNRAYF